MNNLWLQFFLGSILLVIIGGVFFYFVVYKILWLKKAEKSTPLVSHFIDLNEGKVHFVEQGQGRPILLIHGIGANIFTWRFLIPLLAKEFRVIAIDLPGFGKSFKNDKLHYGLDDQARRVVEFLEKLNIKKVHLIGSSMGGALSLWVAKQFPNLVETVTTLAPATDPKLFPNILQKTTLLSPIVQHFLTPSMIAVLMKRVVTKPTLINEESIQAYSAPYVKNPEAIRVFLLASKLITDTRMPKSFIGLKPPHLLLWGKKDLLVPEKPMLQLSSILPKNCQMKTHPTAGHHIMEDDPEWCLQQFKEFIGKPFLN